MELFNTCKSSSGYKSVPTNSEGVATRDLPPPRQLNASEALIARRKCKRCGQFYTLKDERRTCFYHPGEYREPKDRSGALVGWSCCAVTGFSDPYGLNSVLREAAFQRDCKGCKSLPKHTEDENYARAIGIFPFDANAALIQQLNPAATVATTSTETPGKTPTPDVVNKYYILHTLMPTDTLQGLALRYRVTVSAIKRANNMISDTMSHLHKIVIPTSGEVKLSPSANQDPKLEVIKQFKKRTGASAEEAKFYLGVVEYNVDKAVSDFQSDVAWEKKNGTSATKR